MIGIQGLYGGSHKVLLKDVKTKLTKLRVIPISV